MAQHQPIYIEFIWTGMDKPTPTARGVSIPIDVQE